MKKILLATLLFLLTAGLSQAADTAPPAKSDPAWLTQARASIKSEKYN